MADHSPMSKKQQASFNQFAAQDEARLMRDAHLAWCKRQAAASAAQAASDAAAHDNYWRKV